MRVRRATGEEAVLVIAVPREDGTVRASLGATAIELDASEVGRLVDLYRIAQKVALQDRGHW